MLALEASVAAAQSRLAQEQKRTAKLEQRIQTAEADVKRHRVALADATASLAVAVDLGQSLTAKITEVKDRAKSIEVATAADLDNFLQFVDTQVENARRDAAHRREKAAAFAQHTMVRRLEGQKAVADLQRQLQVLQAQAASLAHRRATLERDPRQEHQHDDLELSDDDDASLSDVQIEPWCENAGGKGGSTDLNDIKARADLESRRKQALIRRRIALRHEQAAVRRKISQGRTELRQAELGKASLEQQRRVLEARLKLMSGYESRHRGTRSPVHPRNPQLPDQRKGIRTTSHHDGERQPEYDSPRHRQLGGESSTSTAQLLYKARPAASVTASGGSPSRRLVRRRRTPHQHNHGVASKPRKRRVRSKQPSNLKPKRQSSALVELDERFSLLPPA